MIDYHHTLATMTLFNEGGSLAKWVKALRLLTINSPRSCIPEFESELGFGEVYLICGWVNILTISFTSYTTLSALL